MSRPGEIPIEPFRERVEELLDHGVTWSELAKRCGFTYNRRGWAMADSSRLRRTLGFYPWKGSYSQKLRIETAEKLAEGLGMDPHEVGL